jgi:Transposase DDE domain
MIDLTELYVEIDDFCRKICENLKSHLIGSNIEVIIDTPGLNLSEVLTILIYYHFSRFDCIKHYYLIKVNRELREFFPKLPSYNRFVERIKEVPALAALYLQYKQTKYSGSGYIDSTPLEVCTKKRTKSHKVFEFEAKLGKSSKGWFFGFKLHVICDFLGNIISCKVTPGNANDLKVAVKMLKNLKGKIYADRGYIGKNEFKLLLEQGLILVTGIKKNMKNRLLELWDKILLKKRSLIESIFNVMKSSLHLEHSRHRSVVNAAVYILTTLIAYCWKPNKPKITFTKQEIELLQQLNLLD